MSVSSVRDPQAVSVDEGAPLVVTLVENEKDAGLRLSRDGAAAAVDKKDRTRHRATRAKQVLSKSIFVFCLGITVY